MWQLIEFGSEMFLMKKVRAKNILSYDTISFEINALNPLDNNNSFVGYNGEW